MYWQTILKYDGEYKLAKRSYKLLLELYSPGWKYSVEGIYQGEVKEFLNESIIPMLRSTTDLIKELCVKLSIPLLTNDIFEDQMTARMPQEGGMITLTSDAESKVEELIKLLSDKMKNTIKDYYILE
tara:strand:+ start:125 stop:505 length:381 start_codon:yes stop_codon:yes gene_type:complete